MKIIIIVAVLIINIESSFAIIHSKDSAFLAIQLSGSFQTETTYIPIHEPNNKELYKRNYSLTINLENPEVIDIQKKCELTTWIKFLELKSNFTRCQGFVFVVSKTNIKSNTKDNIHIELTGALKKYREIEDYIYTDFKNFEIKNNILSFEINKIPTNKNFDLIESLVINKKSSALTFGNDRNILGIYDFKLDMKNQEENDFYYSMNNHGTFKYNLNLNLAGFDPQKGKIHRLTLELAYRQNPNKIWHITTPKDIKTRFVKEVIFK